MAQWRMSDEFWANVEPLVPKPPSKRLRRRAYQRRPGGGRKPLETRVILEAILYVLRTGCQWKALPEERFGSASAVHKYFLDWCRQGFFTELWQAGLAEWNEMEGIAWAWHRRPPNGQHLKRWCPVAKTRHHSHSLSAKRSRDNKPTHRTPRTRRTSASRMGRLAAIS